MAWSTPKTENSVCYWYEASTLPSSATTGYSTYIDFLGGVLTAQSKGYVELICVASAVSGTNLDIGVYGSFTTTGTKYLLLDAPVADVTNAAKTATGSVNLAAYPMPYYFIGWITDADESANTITVYIAAGNLMSM